MTITDAAAPEAKCARPVSMGEIGINLPMTVPVIGNSIFMDAIGMSVGLAGASFGSNEGYTIFAGSFYAINNTSNNAFVSTASKTFDNPVQGIMGWFGSSEANQYAQTEASKSASTSFTTNVALEPKFIAPNVVYERNLSETSSIGSGCLQIIYTPGITTTIDLTVYAYSSGRYAAICCYFYIFF